MATMQRLFIAYPSDNGDPEYILAESKEEASKLFEEHIKLSPEEEALQVGPPLTWSLHETDYISKEA